MSDSRCRNCGAPREPACTCRNVHGTRGIIGVALDASCKAVKHDPSTHVCRYCRVYQ